MAVTDPIADLLTRTRNAVSVLHPSVSAPFSRLKEDIVKILKQEGFVRDYSVTESKTGSQKKTIKIELKYSSGNQPAILGMKRISKPGCRVYVKTTDIPRVLNGMGVTILSTSKGVMTGRDSKRNGLGGELLCEIW
ncbi:MAG: 30S ribosomal protein S8 [bacterium]